MIHVFSGCKEACSLPGKACTACGKCFDQIDCKPCNECCEQCGASLSNFFSKPLGIYVVFAVLISAVEVGCCLYSICQPDLLKACEFKEGLGESVGVTYWLYGQLGTAWLNLIFAPYIQFRLWENLQQESQDVVDEQGHGSAYAGQSAQVPQAQVKQAFSDVFWNDIGVCIYVFVLIGSCGWSYLGLDWVSGNPSCDPDGFSSYAAELGMCAFFFAVVAFVAFSCYLECMSTLEVTPARYLMPDAAAALTQQAIPGARGAQAPPKNGGFLGGIFGSKPQQQNMAASSTPPPTAPPLQPPQRTAAQRACTPGQLTKLVACILLDLFGNLTYFVPGLGEGVDAAYAPSQAVALKMLFQSNRIALVGFAEEILPFTDFCPTATIAWFMDINGVFDYKAQP